MARSSGNERRLLRRPLKEQAKDLLALHRGERRGTAALVLLLVALFAAVAYQQWLRPPRQHDLSALRAEMQAWLAQRDSLNRAADSTASPAPELFPFDPNAIGPEEWRRLGLSQRQAEAIGRFRQRGGRFRTKADVGRLYTISDAQYERLKPWILLPDSAGRGAAREPWRPKPEPRAIASADADPATAAAKPAPDRAAPRRLEVNTADTAALIALPGIGPAFARGIVKYRDQLGGYHSLAQLAEVHVLKDKPDAVARLKELLVIDTLAIRRIAVNTCTVEELAAHPYARWRIAKPVIAYRQHHGPFRGIGDLRALPVLDEEALRKLAPYLSFE